MTHLIGRRGYKSEAYPTRGASTTSGGTAPLSNVFYIDPHSTDAGPADGSDEHPFTTIQQAFDAVFPGTLIGAELTFLITPCFFGDNAGALVLPDNLTGLFMSIVGLSGSNRPILTSVESSVIGSSPTVDTITGGDNSSNISISFQSCSVNTIDLGEEGVSGGRLSFDGAQIGQIDCNVYEVLAVASALGETQCATLEAYSSSGQDCTWTADEIRVDSATRFQIAQNNVTLSLNNPTVMSRMPQATISVAVPVLATDALGYVDVSTVGTELEGINIGDSIVANPTTDLAGAGAGNGGFLNCRVSAADTIRCAFAGALPGGAANFTFARVN